ncbi:hypothetical protein C7477_105157 [Phyllobacterium leguminum]|uniref:Uncharacterized protein n=1 Tax=Phyllobacterium leguminum TaxID=314237 RepID=A0A318TJ04_9HYPH|nr:hypothetical protein C7477_105157 [Phyllobacterium leguminum]
MDSSDKYWNPFLNTPYWERVHKAVILIRLDKIAWLNGIQPCLF